MDCKTTHSNEYDIIMFRLQFRKSKSKYYNKVVSLADIFYKHTVIDDVHTIHISLKELFEKFEYFSNIYWMTENWKGSTFGYDDYDLHSKDARKRLFYNLQQAYTKWLCLSDSYLSELHKVYFDVSIDEALRKEVFNETDIDIMLDLILAEKNRKKHKDENK